MNETAGNGAADTVLDFRTAVAALSALFLIGGLGWPHLAGRLLGLLLAILAVAYAGRRAYRARLPGRLTADVYSPFDRHPTETPELKLPGPIHDLARLLAAADDDESSHRSAIPLAVQRIVCEEARRRLRATHELALDDPTHASQVRRVLSEPMWGLIGPDHRHPHRPLLRDPVPLRHLGDILDELERL